MVEKKSPSRFRSGGHYRHVLGVTYCDKLNLLVSVGVDSLVRLWDPRTGLDKCVDELRGHNDSIVRVVCDPGNETQV